MTATQFTVADAPDLSDLPAPPVYPTGETLRPLITGDQARDLRTALRLHKEGKARQHAYDIAVRAAKLQKDGAPFRDILCALAAAEEAAPADARPWHAARLDAYTGALGLRGWHRRSNHLGEHRIQINYLRLPADGDRSRYYSRAGAYMHLPLNHWVIDRDTGRTVYRSYSGRIAQQWINETERTP